MYSFDFTTSFAFDPKRGCLTAPFELGEGPLLSAHDWQKTLRSLEGMGRPDMAFMLNSFMPLAVPMADMTPYKTGDDTPVVVMCPPPGHLPMHYDLKDPSHLALYLQNRSVSMNWEMMRQALSGLGARVIVADSVWDLEPGGCLIPAPSYPVNEVFARDAGMIVSDLFLATSQSGHAKALSHSVDEEMPLLQLFGGLSDIFDVMADMKRKHAEKVVAAFHRAGVSLVHKEIEPFFEGGDIIVDPARGILFMGRDTDPDLHGRRRNDLDLAKTWRATTGLDVVVIERDYGRLFDEGKERDRYHLDTFMALLPGGEMLFDPRHTSSESADKIRHIYGDDLIPVPAEEPEYAPGFVSGENASYPTNLVAVGHSLLMPKVSAPLRAALDKKGYVPVTGKELNAPDGCFFIGGGGAHCVTHTMPCRLGS